MQSLCLGMEFHEIYREKITSHFESRSNKILISKEFNQNAGAYITVLRYQIWQVFYFVMRDPTHLKANVVHISMQDLGRSHFGLNLTLCILEFVRYTIPTSA